MIDFGKIAKAIATKGLTAMGTGVGGMIGGALVGMGIAALAKSTSTEPPELPEPEKNGTEEAADATEVEVETPVMEEGTEVEVNLNEDRA